jgi:hypothetical protein
MRPADDRESSAKTPRAIITFSGRFSKNSSADSRDFLEVRRLPRQIRGGATYGKSIIQLGNQECISRCRVRRLGRILDDNRSKLMSKHVIFLFLFLAMAIQAGCKNQPKTAAAAGVTNIAAARVADSPNASATSQDAAPSTVSAASQSSDPPSASATLQYSDPPSVGVGPSVEEAYAAIPHRRTVWDENGSTIPTGEKEYLQTMFQVLDQAVRVRVAGQQAYSNQQFDSADIDGEFNRLIVFARSMPVPTTLNSYHQQILSALSSERQYFADWKSQGDRFPFAQQVANHPGVRSASANLRSAYGELMSKYPNESPSNKDAFFDYHCALDFL